LLNISVFLETESRCTNIWVTAGAVKAIHNSKYQSYNHLD